MNVIPLLAKLQYFGENVFVYHVVNFLQVHKTTRKWCLLDNAFCTASWKM